MGRSEKADRELIDVIEGLISDLVDFRILDQLFERFQMDNVVDAKRARLTKTEFFKFRKMFPAEFTAWRNASKASRAARKVMDSTKQAYAKARFARSQARWAMLGNTGQFWALLRQYWADRSAWIKARKALNNANNAVFAKIDAYKAAHK